MNINLKAPEVPKISVKDLNFYYGKFTRSRASTSTFPRRR
jgi:hypothetical protein